MLLEFTTFSHNWRSALRLVVDTEQIEAVRAESHSETECRVAVTGERPHARIYTKSGMFWSVEETLDEVLEQLEQFSPAVMGIMKRKGS